MSMAPCSHPPSPFHSPPLCAELGLQFWEDQICPADSELLIAATIWWQFLNKTHPLNHSHKSPLAPLKAIAGSQLCGPLSWTDWGSRAPAGAPRSERAASWSQGRRFVAVICHPKGDPASSWKVPFRGNLRLKQFMIPIVLPLGPGQG